jgi:hypothetical protein
VSVGALAWRGIHPRASNCGQFPFKSLAHLSCSFAFTVTINSPRVGLDWALLRLPYEREENLFAEFQPRVSARADLIARLFSLLPRPLCHDICPSVFLCAGWREKCVSKIWLYLWLRKTRRLYIYLEIFCCEMTCDVHMPLRRL